jgi:hypothetical protein
MTKWNEIGDISEKQSKINFVDASWSNWYQTRQQTLSRITNYLFVLNTGGLIGSLTYFASQGASGDIQLTIKIFAFGILFSVLHAALDYYSVEYRFSSFRDKVNLLYSNKLDWEELRKPHPIACKIECLLHFCGWVGAGLFFFGLYFGVNQIK